VTPRPRAPRGARRQPINTYAPPEPDPLSDSRLRPLVERYASLARATLEEVGPHVFELRVPKNDRPFFDGRDRVLLAFAVGALQHSPDAEMAVVGSPFVEQLLAAIRARGTRLSAGLVPSKTGTGTDVPPPVPLRNATAGTPVVRVARHPVGRLLARVLIRAGGAVEEHLVESAFFDFATGAPLPREAAESCAVLERGDVAPATSKKHSTVNLAPARPIGDVIDLMVAHLQAQLAPRVDELRAEAVRALASELARIDAYYGAMLQDAGAKESDGIAMDDAARAVQAEHARRRLEEERRHQVHAVIHPLQLVEMEMLVQRAEWTLSTKKGQRATLAARRFGGAAGWSLSCPTCTREPSALVLCGADEIACESCAKVCTVCAEGFREEDTVECGTCERPVCEKHRAACDVGHEMHCSPHLARTNRSRRIVCKAHRAACTHEPNATFAADEVAECPVCARPSCPSHMQPCTNCGRRVCVGEWKQATSSCATCRRLEPYPTPSQIELEAAADAIGGRPPDPTKWRAARDATHLVVELSQGWMRRAVFTVRHGGRRAATVVSHSRGESRRTR